MAAGAHEEAVRFPAGQVVQFTVGTFPLQLIDVLANDVHAVALCRGHGTRAGRTLDNPTCLRMRLANGRIAEIWELMWDLYAVDEFWA